MLHKQDQQQEQEQRERGGAQLTSAQGLAANDWLKIVWPSGQVYGAVIDEVLEAEDRIRVT